MRHCTALALLLALFAPCAAAETYYADPLHGKAANAGSRQAPWGSLEEVIATGSLARLKGGDTLLLRGGKHGRAVFSGDNAEFITLAADRGEKPQLSYLEITSGTKWRIKGLTISASLAEKPYDDVMVKIADGGPSGEIIVEDCFVYTALDTSRWTAKEWMAANSGMFMGRHGKGHVFRNNYVFNTRFGISLCSEDSLCEGNVISHFSADGIRVTRDGLIVRHNVIRNIYVSDGDGDKNHDDAIQCFLFNKGTGTVRNVTVSENLIVMRENEAQKWQATMQGIGFFDGPLINFTVEGNVINTSHWHGVTLSDAQDCSILNNVCFTQWTEAKLRPWVQLGTKNVGPVKGNRVKGNYAYTFDLKADKDVAAEKNEVVTPEIHSRRQAELLEIIEKKFGAVHPVAAFRRLGLERIRWQEGAVLEEGGEKFIDAVQQGMTAGKLVVIYVYSRDARNKAALDACERLEREVLEDAAVCEQLDAFACVRIALDDALPKDMKKRYSIGSRAPGLIVLDAQGKKLWESSSPSAKALAAKLKELKG
ncbi:right-handed parallel beta-helix repeat-containing protein [bacterium]|nr:MAG: right-handed parallel beta-helix repeat-containing protein [bacterium]RIK59548.1 MAG: hypothetical protein DCC64_15750 [Planctomycetota bacterium]